MKASEFVSERRKRSKKPRWAAYGPGPYGGYGFAIGYSGDAGVGTESTNKLTIVDAIRDFLPIAIKTLKLKELPRITFSKDVDSKHDQPTFGVYHHDGRKLIAIDIEERHPIDIIRTLAHELVHFKQDLEGRLTDNSWKTGSPTENEAHEKAGIMLRMFDKEHPEYLKLQAVEFNIDEGWKDWVAGAGVAAMAAGGGGAAWDAYKSSQAEKEPTAVVAKADDKRSDFEKGVIKIAKDAVPKKAVTNSPHEKYLTKAAVEAGIKGEELAQFLAQTAHESHNFKSMVEYGGSLDFKKYEPKFVKDKKTGKLVQVNPKAKTLGNIQKGDGARYKGRGYIQLTGRYNYKKAGEALGLPLEDKPELVEKPEIAAKVAIWFWQQRVQPKVDNFYDTRASTKPINPGLKGLEDRKEKFKDFKMAMR